MSEPDTQFCQDQTPAAVVLSVHDLQGCKVHPAPPPAIRVGTQQAALSRLVGQGLQIALPAIDARLSIHLSTHEPHAGWPAALILSGPDGAMEIEEGARLLRVLTGIDVGDAAERGGADAKWLLSAVLGRLAGTPFSSFDRVATTTSSPAKSSQVLRLVLRSSGHLVSTHLRGEPHTFSAFLARAGWSPIRQPLSAYAQMSMPVDLHIGRHVLSAERIRTLSPGDILLPESTTFNTAGEGWFPFGRLRIHVRHTGPGTLRVLDVVRHTRIAAEAGAGEDSSDSPGNHTNMSKGGGMEDHHEDDAMHAEHAGISAGPAAPPVADTKSMDDSSELDEVGVTLQFMLGKANMTLGDMRSLAAGSVILFAGGSPESVAIVSSGRTLGRGEVVDVDGRLGVRITHWGHEGE